MTTIKTKLTLLASGLIMLLMAGFAMFSAQQAFAAGATESVGIAQDLPSAAFSQPEDCMMPFDVMPATGDIEEGDAITFFDDDLSEEEIQKEIIAAEKEFLQSLVKDGTITQKEADEMLAQLEKDLANMGDIMMGVNDPCAFPVMDDDCMVDMLPMPYDMGSDMQIFDGDMTDEEIKAALRAEEEKYLQELVKDGTITQKEADEMLADFDVFFEEGGLDMNGDFVDGMGAFEFDGDMTEEEIIAELRAEEEKYIQELVKDGTITQAEADELLADFEVFFEDVPLDFEGEMFPCDDFGADTYFSTLMEVLGLEEDALFDALDAGKTIAEIAKDQDVAVQAVIDALVKSEKAFIEEMVADGYISQTDANEWIADLEKQITFDVNYTYPDAYSIAAKILNVSVEDLWSAVDEGKSIADVAKDKGVDSQRIIDAIVKAEKDYVQAQADADLISETEAKIWTAELEDYAKSMVEDSFLAWGVEAIPFESEN